MGRNLVPQMLLTSSRRSTASVSALWPMWYGTICLTSASRSSLGSDLPSRASHSSPISPARFLRGRQLRQYVRTTRPSAAAGSQ